jgi:energy-coupling factor transport system ATP-binding protein
LRDSGFPYDERRPTSALSGGEGQRLALAGALALRPGLLLLDEPAAMLDHATAATVREAVLAVVRETGCTLVVVEHRMAPWLDHVDRLVVLSDDGHLLADGAPGSVVSEHAAALAGLGIWLDDVAPVTPVSAPARAQEPGRPLLTATALVGRPMGWRSASPAALVGPFDTQVRAATVTAVTGPSGAGKSTALGLLAGLSTPAAGSLVADAAWCPRRERRPHRWRSRELAQRIAWLPQLPEHAVVAGTVREEVMVTSRALGLDAGSAASRADELLGRLGLTALADRDPHHLSGGEQRRLGLAAALAHRPDLLLLDEPTVGQDRLTWLAVLAAVTDAVAEGAAVAVATHDTELLAAIGGAVAFHELRLGAALPALAGVTS